MEIEQLIKRIAEEVYGQIRAERDKSGGAAAAAGGSEWLLCRMRPGMRVDEVKAACEAAKAVRARALCIPQWFVDYAVAELAGSGVKAATVVGLPGGGTSPFAKYAEVKQAVVSGAEVILIPVNMQLLAAGDWGAAKNDLADAMTPCRDKAAVYAVLETGALGPDQLGTAAELCSSCGVDAVLLSAVTGGAPTEAQVRSVRSKGVCAGVFGGATGERLAAYRQAGASCFAVSQLP